MDSIGLPWDNIKNRDIVSFSVKAHTKNENDDQWHDKLKDNKEITKKIMSSKVFKHLAKPFDKLREFRNDINHGGYSKHSRKPEKFKKSLEYIYKDVINIISDIT